VTSLATSLVTSLVAHPLGLAYGRNPRRCRFYTDRPTCSLATSLATRAEMRQLAGVIISTDTDTLGLANPNIYPNPNPNSKP
jgi:hypothetical protein